MSRPAIFAGKALANAVFVLAVQALALPAVALFFDLPLDGDWWVVGPVVVLAALGLAAVGTLFAAIAANTRLADLLLPMMTLPFFVPLVIPAAQATAVVLRGQPVAEATAWLRVLLAYDLVFLSASCLVFPFTIEE